MGITKEERQYYKSIRICTSCLCRSVEIGHSMCSICIAKRRQYNRKYRKLNKDSIRERNLKRRKAHLEQGLCSECVKPVCLESKRFCKEHYLKNKRKSSENWRKQKAARTLKEENDIKQSKLQVSIRNLSKARLKSKDGSEAWRKEIGNYFYLQKVKKSLTLDVDSGITSHRL